MRNKVYIILTGMLCVGAALSCSFEVPETVSVKGQPGLYINLGSPFGGENTLVDKFLNPEGLKDQLGNSPGRVYTYQGDDEAKNDIQTYLISFPLIDPGNLPPALQGAQGSLPKPVEIPGSIPNLAIHEIVDFLGGAHFDSVPAYLYISGMTGTVSFYSQFQGEAEKHYRIPEEPDITWTPINPKPAFIDKDAGEETWGDLIIDADASHTFDCKDEFNSKKNVGLYYTLKVDGVTTSPDKVKADLVLKLPLQFFAPLSDEKGNSQEVTLGGKDYVTLNLAALPRAEEGEDLLGREKGSDDNLFDRIRSVKIFVTEIQNTAIDNLYLGIQKKERVLRLDNDPSANEEIAFLEDELDPPFNPGFLILVAKSDNRIIVKPAGDEPPEFDFTLAISAQAELNIEMDL